MFFKFYFKTGNTTLILLNFGLKKKKYFDLNIKKKNYKKKFIPNEI